MASSCRVITSASTQADYICLTQCSLTHHNALLHNAMFHSAKDPVPFHAVHSLSLHSLSAFISRARTRAHTHTQNRKSTLLLFSQKTELCWGQIVIAQTVCLCSKQFKAMRLKMCLWIMWLSQNSLPRPLILIRAKDCWSLSQQTLGDYILNWSPVGRKRRTTIHIHTVTQWEVKPRCLYWSQVNVALHHQCGSVNLHLWHFTTAGLFSWFFKFVEAIIIPKPHSRVLLNKTNNSFYQFRRQLFVLAVPCATANLLSNPKVSV